MVNAQNRSTSSELEALLGMWQQLCERICGYPDSASAAPNAREDGFRKRAVDLEDYPHSIGVPGFVRFSQQPGIWPAGVGPTGPRFLRSARSESQEASGRAPAERARAVSWERRPQGAGTAWRSFIETRAWRSPRVSTAPRSRRFTSAGERRSPAEAGRGSPQAPRLRAGDFCRLHHHLGFIAI